MEIGQLVVVQAKKVHQGDVDIADGDIDRFGGGSDEARV